MRRMKNFSIESYKRKSMEFVIYFLSKDINKVEKNIGVGVKIARKIYSRE